jgi:hypothetical protein
MAGERQQQQVPQQAPPPEQPVPLRPGLDVLTGVILAGWEFARDTGGELFALPRDGVLPYIPRSFLTSDVMNLAHDLWHRMAVEWNSYRAEHPDAGRPVAVTPSDTLIRNAVRHCEALAAEHGRRVSAELRAVQRDGTIIIDLGDDTGEVAVVTAGSWQVCDPRSLPGGPPVFRRSAGYGPLPRPVRGGGLDELWKILRITDQAAIVLVEGWLTASYFAGVPRPGIWLTGPPGAGKTTAGGGAARLTDGTEWLDGRLDKTDERNNIIRAATAYVVSFDNMTAVTADLSDWICQLVTGHRDKFRKMRTNFEDISMAYRRTFVATGLSLPYGLGADALDRVIEVPLTAITDAGRVNEDTIRHELDEARPRLLGALLDNVAAVLALLPRFTADGSGIARMNGYAQILMALDATAGTGGTPHLSAYLAAARTAREDRADGEPVIVALGKAIAPGGSWQGTATELWTALSGHRSYAFGSDTWWPADSRRLSDHLTAQDSMLRTAGFAISRGRINSGRTRVIRIERHL